jgi:monovalent cation:H+ antiporter-2, CPA2 family
MMTHEIDIILTLTGGLTAALLLGLVTQWLRLSPIVGYLAAGIVVGPFTPGFIAQGAIAEQFAELGIILLMFGVGLKLHFGELLAVRWMAIPGALVQMVVSTAMGALVAHYARWSVNGGILFGLALAVSSTVVAVRSLADRELLHTPVGHLAMGWLVVEDLLTVLLLVLVPLVLSTGPATTGVNKTLAASTAILKLGGLAAFTLVVGRSVIPALLGLIAKTRSRELFTLSVLVLALGIAVGSAKLFGASMALGAFLAGIVVGQSEFSSRAASEALPMRDSFAVLFFVSMGMLLDPRQILANAPLIAGVLAVILVGTPLTVLILALVLRCKPRTAVPVAATLAQIGEFSFILMTLGRRLDILPERATQCLVAAAIISIAINPLYLRLARYVANQISTQSSRPGLGFEASSPVEASSSRAVIVGYGPVGQTLSRLLRENGIVPTIVELNHETVQHLTKNNVHAIYGDAAQPQILADAGIRHATSLIYTALGSPDSVIRAAKEQNPNILIIARTSYVADVPALRRIGTDTVVSAEGEVALAMTERLLRKLGATDDQLDRARDRVRVEFMA